MILDWATVQHYRSGPNPARWKGHLSNLLSNPGKVRRTKHHPALRTDAIPAFMVELRTHEGLGSSALEFCILAAARSGEVRGAQWPEIDLDGRLWTVPKERMKSGREHRVPLSDAAAMILLGLPRIAGTELLFPSTRGAPLSDMTLTAVLRRIGAPAVPHGFRSTFRDWCARASR